MGAIVVGLTVFLCAAPASAQEAGPAVTVLLYHPDDGVDPFGFPYGDSDAFTVRYGSLVADKQRFDFPFLVVDGVLVYETLPDPQQPFAATFAAYDGATARRLGQAAPATLVLATSMVDEVAAVHIEVLPVAPVQEQVRLWVALTEDPVHFLPPPGLTNGVADHRFTLRAIADLGFVALDAGSNRSHAFPLPEAWARDRLSVAAWLQADAPTTRWDPREVVQATHAPLGDSVRQESKGVLLEMLSATWCDPCLYGDLAVEEIAIARGGAAPLPEGAASSYFHPSSTPLAAVLAAVACGLAVAWWGGRR